MGLVDHLICFLAVFQVEEENSILPYWLSNASALLCLLQRNIRSNGFLSASSKRSAGSTGLNGRITQVSFAVFLLQFSNSFAHTSNHTCIMKGVEA